jgi:hypothetical protein
VIDGVIKMFNEKYGKEAPLAVTRGKVHEYLGMTIDYSKEEKVKFTMFDYVQNMLDELPAGTWMARQRRQCHHTFSKWTKRTQRS